MKVLVWCARCALIGAMMGIYFLSGQVVIGQVTGTVFRDFDGDGVQSGVEPGIEGVRVRAFTNAPLPNKDQLVGVAITDSMGNYVLNVLSYPIRIEFDWSAVECVVETSSDFPALGGAVYGSSVQFAYSSGEIHNCAIQYPYDYEGEENPYVFVALYGNGDPIHPSSNLADEPALVRLRYLWSGIASNSGRGSNTGHPWDTVVVLGQVGSIYGLAYSRQAKKIWMAASVRRHAGMGPLGPGGIYWVDADAPYDHSADLKFVNFHELGIATSDTTSPYVEPLTPGSCPPGEVLFSAVVGTNAERGIPPSQYGISRDVAAWSQVGKLSFGDMDISEDGRYLYVVNLYDRKLYEIDLMDPYNPQVPTLANASDRIKGYSIPDPCIGNIQGEYRPWGLKVRRGKVYVGIICSGEDSIGRLTGASAYDLTANVYSFDIQSKSWSAGPVVPPFNFSYRNSSSTPWYSWINYMTYIFPDWAEASPILTDIEFDLHDQIILGFADRLGFQLGHWNMDPCGNCCYRAVPKGDLIPYRWIGSNCDMQSILNPEYYADQLFYFHPESILGALGVHYTPDFDGILTSFLGPIGIWSAGVMLYDNQNGQRYPTQNASGFYQAGYEILYGYGRAAQFSKSNPLGDLEVVQYIAPIEIGNRVWLDSDGDGIQDPDEPGIAGVIVELLDSDQTVLATDTTDAKGEYYFNHTNVQPPLGIKAEQSYTLRISPSQFAQSQGLIGAPLENYILTRRDEMGFGLIDKSDNDAAVSALGYAEIEVAPLREGATRHHYDFGFVQPCAIGDTVWHDLDANGIQDDGEPGIEGVKVTLYRADSTPVAVQYTDAAGFYLFEYLMPGEYFLGFMYPDKWEKTYAHVGTNDYRDSDVDDSNGPNTTPTTYLSPGEIDERWDLGLYMCIPVGDFVWFDWDADGIQDPGENGINGVRVYVIDARTDEIVASTVTRGHPKRASDDGYWKVCVRPGSYYVKVARPGTLAVSGPFRGGDNTRDSDINHGNGLYTTYTFTVYSGDRLCDVDAGFHHQAVVGNYVWVDEDGDGYQDSGEPPVEGVIVRAYTMDNMMISETETDATGRYELEGLSEGSYYVRYVVPDGYDFTIPNAGPEEMDSDVDGSHGFGTTGEIRVRAGDVRPEIDAGVVYGVLATVVKGIRGWHEGGENVIEWEVIESEGRYRYRLERRVDGGKYEVVYDREVEGSGSERVYRYADRDVLKGGLYEYRLRVEEVGVREVLSERVSIYVRGEEGAGMVRVLPNPVDDELRVEYVSGGEERWTFGLYNSTGEMVDHWEEEVEDAGLQLSRRSVRYLSSGVYLLFVRHGKITSAVKVILLNED